MTDIPARVLCIGDRFITPESFATAAVRLLGPDTEVVTYGTDWPDEPFIAVEGVREASGDVREIRELVRDVTVIVTHLGPITASVIDAAPHLKVIGVTRGGPVNVDLESATRRHIPVLDLPGRNLNAVAEFVIGLMITLPRGIARSSRDLSNGEWSPRAFHFDQAGSEIRAMNVGLVGLGAVGQRVAALVTAFGGRVRYFDPFVSPDATRSIGAESVSLDELLDSCDVISVHARLTDETRGLFDARRFAAMRAGSYFINTARGELVDQGALVDSLESGHLAGAALDVFHPEPPDFGDRLLQMPQVIATPHLAGASRQVATDSIERVLGEVRRYLDLGTVEHCANPAWNPDRHQESR